MLLAAAKTLNHTVLPNDWTVYVTFFSGVAATWVTIYFKVIRPRQQEHLKHQAEREEARKAEEYRMTARWNIIDGMAGVPGMYDAVPPAAIRLQILEQKVHALENPPPE